MNSKKCCVPGCEDSGGTRRPLHLFPNPTKDSDRFAKWIQAIRGDIIGHNNEYIFINRRVCHAHFEEKYCCRYGKLSNIALPTLNLSGSLSLPRFTLLANPMKQTQNLPTSSTSELRNKPNGTLELSNENTEIIDPIQVNSTIAQETLDSKVSHISKTVPSVSASGICVSAPSPQIIDPIQVNSTITQETLDSKVSHISKTVPSVSPSGICVPAPSPQIIASIQVNSTIAQETLDSKVSHISKTVPSVSASGICVPAPSPRTRTKCMLKTQAEKTLHQELLRMRVKLSKMKSKVKKLTASLKASKDFHNHPKFLETMENLPFTARILISMQLREYKKKSKGRRFTLDEKILALALYKISPKAYRFLRKVLILPAIPALIKLVQT